MSGELDPPRRDLVEGDRFFEEKIESILSSVFLRDSFGGAVMWSIDLHASCRRKVHGVRAWNRSTAHQHPDTVDLISFLDATPPQYQRFG